MAWEPGSPEYNAWSSQNATKTNTAAPGYDIFGMPLPTAPAPPDSPAPGAPGGDTPPTGQTAEQRSAKAIIQGALAQYGLGSLGDKLWGQYLSGAPQEQIFLQLRNEPEYKTRFAGMDALAKKGRAITENQYIDYERTYANLAHQFGFPDGVVDKATTDAWIAGEVAPTEVRDRFQLASQAATQAPKEVRDELNRLYGVDLGHLTAYYLNPDKALPVLQQQFAAGQLGAASKRTGYGNLSAAEAERLASLGISEDQAAKGFGNLAQSSELFGSLPGENGDTISRADQLGATFEGNSDAIRRLNKRAAERRAQFEGGGQFVTTSQGVSGLGSAAS